MTPEKRILRDLASGQATARALADTLRLQPEAVAIILARLEREGRVRSHALGGVLVGVPVYHLPPAPAATP